MNRKMKTDIMDVAHTMRDHGDIPSDVQGSYTGTAEKSERPVQDADDL